ncbi:hypothetical protein P7C70_g1489, partial [Phenoliferia sp. Uapishka_3]
MAHLLHSQLVNMRMGEHESVAEFVHEFELKKGRLGTMWIIVTQEQALLYLMAALPKSHQDTTIRVFFEHQGYKSRADAASAKSFISNSSPSPLPSPSSSSSTFYSQSSNLSITPTTAHVANFRDPTSGILYDNKGVQIICHTEGCFENRTQRDFPRNKNDVQNLAEGEGKQVGRSPEQKLKAKEKKSRAKVRFTGKIAKLEKYELLFELSEEGGAISSLSFIGAEQANLLQTRSLEKKSTTWLFNTASDHHCSDQIHLFKDLSQAKLNIEGIIEGASLVANQKGTISILSNNTTGASHTRKLRDILYSPDMTNNILSVPILADKGATIVFCPSGGKLVISGKVTIERGAVVIPLKRNAGAFLTVTDVPDAHGSQGGARFLLENGKEWIGNSITWWEMDEYLEPSFPSRPIIPQATCSASPSLPTPPPAQPLPQNAPEPQLPLAEYVNIAIPHPSTPPLADIPEQRAITPPPPQPEIFPPTPPLQPRAKRERKTLRSLLSHWYVPAVPDRLHVC